MKKYEAIKIEMLIIDSVDVITASGNPTEPIHDPRYGIDGELDLI